MVFFLYIKWSLNKTPLLCGVIDVPGVGVGLVFGAGWAGVESQLLQLNRFRCQGFS